MGYKNNKVLWDSQKIGSFINVNKINADDQYVLIEFALALLMPQGLYKKNH